MNLKQYTTNNTHLLDSIWNPVESIFNFTFVYDTLGSNQAITLLKETSIFESDLTNINYFSVMDSTSLNVFFFGKFFI